jgi:subtilisin family serine protease
MKARSVLAALVVAALVIPAGASASPQGGRRQLQRPNVTLPEGFRPAVVRMREPHRYLVQMRAPASARSGRDAAALRASQADAIRAVEARGGVVLNRFSLLLNGFSAQMTALDAAVIRRFPGVERVQPSVIVTPGLTTSVPFIGAPKVWNQLSARGQGVTVAVIDSGVDYTHADFGGAGTVGAYEANDPTKVEPGSFPTAKVIGGWDFVGDQGYDPQDPANDTPSPDPDPLDYVANGGDHGTHVAGICCGAGVEGSVGRGVAPKAKILAYKIFDVAGTPDDIVIQAMERAADPNGDGDTEDHADVINMSLGADYSFTPIDNAAVRAATQAGIVVVMSAGNAGNQPNGGPAYVAGAPGNAPAGIGVAASIDQFTASTLDADPAIDWPDTGSIAPQDWAGSLDADLTGDVVDARAFATIADPDGAPAASDQILCAAAPSGSPFAGKIVLVYKGPFADGDCLVDDKVLHAQQAGANGVIIWDGFGGLPTQYSVGTSAASVTIPAVDLSGADSEALAAAISPDAPASYNDETVSVTLHPDPSVIPGFEDRMTDFTSEGPSRVNNLLKPDISAPGFAITSAWAGTGDGNATFDGTSMAAPHVAGAAALLVQLHPEWGPNQVKAALMNHATQKVDNLDGSGPVSAAVIGSGRVQVYPSGNTQVLAEPASLSFQLRGVSGSTTFERSVRVRNLSGSTRRFDVRGATRYSDFSKRFSEVRVSVGRGFASSRTLVVGPHASATVRVRLTLRPDEVEVFEQEYGWYYFNPNTDGVVSFDELGGRDERFHVPWHVSGLAAATSSVSPSSLDLTGDPAKLKIGSGGSGVAGTDLYQLGGKSPADTGLDFDLRAVGARSFTGGSIDEEAEGLPAGSDDLGGIDWTTFLTNADTPAEPIEFGVVTHGVRATTETQEIDVMVDLGADGVVADPTVGADVLIVKLAGPGGNVCVFDLPSTFEGCDALYFADYSNFNSSVTGLVVDASAIGLTNTVHRLSYATVACDLSFDPDSQPGPDCDAIGTVTASGAYDMVFDATRPALSMSAIACGGFWAGACGKAVTIGVGSAAAGDDPRILAIFPNDAPGRQMAVVKTTT